MKKVVISIFLIVSLYFTAIFSLYGERYEPIVGRSGSIINEGTARFSFNYGYSENRSDVAFTTFSIFNFGIDYGINNKMEIQNNIGYGAYNNKEGFKWSNWKELLKIKLSEKIDGPATSLGVGILIPVRKEESLGLVGGFYYSGGIKEITFDFNLGIVPYLTYGTFGDMEVRPSPYINGDIVLGYKLMPFLKLTGGIDMKQYLRGGTTKIKINDTEIKRDIEPTSGWILFVGSRVKPKGYPLLADASISIGLNNDAEFDWRFQIGVQVLPSNMNAEW